MNLKIFIISCIFPPEPLTSATTASDLVDALVAKGHDVTVFTSFPNRPSGCLMKGFKRRWKQVEYTDGYRIIRSWHTLSRRSSFLSRTMENITFGLTSTWQLYLEQRPDIVYMDTWPVFAQGLNSWVLKHFKVPIVCSVQDIFPESLIERGLIQPNSFFSRILQQLDAQHLFRCTQVTTLSHSMVELLIKNRKLPPGKVQYIPNWLDADQFPIDLPKNNSFRVSLGIDPGKFLAVFVGSLTASAGVELYIEVAERLSSDVNVKILLVGDGVSRSKIEREIADKELKNIQVIYPLEQKKVPYVQAAADVLLLSLSGKILNSAAPSKLISYMFSGRPIIASVYSQSVPAQIISEAHAGFILPSQNAQAISDLLRQLSANRFLIYELGKNAKRYAEGNFSKSVVLPQLVNLLEVVAESKI